MQSVSLKLCHLKASLICAADKDIRYYLNGVLVEVRKRDTLLVTTDGHRLCVIRAATVADDEPDNLPVQIIVPRESLKSLKAPRGSDSLVLEYDQEHPLAECKLSGLADGGRTFKPIDGKFPDWCRVVPSVLSGERAYFDPLLVADFLEIVRIVAGKARIYNVSLHQNGNGSAAIQAPEAPEFLGVLMPMRWENGEYSRPAWLDEAQNLKQALAA